MIVSMYRMSAGKGYEYLLRTAVVEGGNGELSTALTRYDSEAGPSRATPVSSPEPTPPGWHLLAIAGNHSLTCVNAVQDR